MPRKILPPIKPISQPCIDNTAAENINTEHRIILDTMVPRNLTILNKVENFDENAYLYIYTGEGVPSRILAIKVGPQKISQLEDDIGLASTADLDQLRRYLNGKYQTLDLRVDALSQQLVELDLKLGNIIVDGQEIK